MSQLSISSREDLRYNCDWVYLYCLHSLARGSHEDSPDLPFAVFRNGSISISLQSYSSLYILNPLLYLTHLSYGCYLTVIRVKA